MSQKSPGKNGFKYRPQFAVIVICTDEIQQAQVYENLRSQGHTCKVVAV